MAETDARAPSIVGLFNGFLILGLTGFGGVLPLARHMVVEQRRWLTAAEFSELLGFCQFLPGGNIINLSTAIGLRFGGVPGAITALVGLLAAPIAIVLVLGVIYGRYRSEPHVMHMFAGLAAAAAGLLIAMAIKLALPLRRRPLALGIAAVVFVAIVFLRLPLVPTMLVMAPLSIFMTLKAGA
jgi:chromate transporter